MQKIPCSRFNFETLNRNNGWKRNPRLPNLCTSLTTDQTQSRTWFFYISSHLLFFCKKKKPNQKIDYRHKFESSTFAFVRFEISTLLKLEISTLQKLEISSFRRVEISRFRRVEISKQTNAKADDSNFRPLFSWQKATYLWTGSKAQLAIK